MWLLTGPDIAPRMSYDPTTIAVLRRALDEVLLDARFHRNRSASALEIAEHILAQAAAGERDLDTLLGDTDLERFLDPVIRKG